MAKEAKNKSEEKDVIEKSIREVYGPSELDGKLLHVKVGCPDWDLEQMQSEVNRIGDIMQNSMDDFGINCQILVTHCFVDINVIESKNSSK